MKKIKLFGLAFAVACVGVIGLTGCTKANQPYDMFISDVQTEFNIGDDFSLGNNFKVNLQFESNKVMTLNNKSSTIDESKKQIKTLDYTLDYSNFDSSKGGTYNIFVTFNDHDNNPNNDLKMTYQVTVKLTNNYWINNLSVTNWVYKDYNFNITVPVARYLNSTIEYYYKETTQNNYTKIKSSELNEKLAALDAGSYQLKAVCPQTNQYSGIESIVNFVVSKSTIPSSIIIPLDAGSKDYTGSVLETDLVSNEYFNVVKGVGNWTDVGQYAVHLTPTKNWLWNDSTNNEKIIYFTITKATNEWINDNFDVALIPELNDVKGWYVDSENPYVIFTTPEAKFGNVNYKWKIKGQDDSQYSLSVTLSELLNLPSQNYTIMAYIPESSNYGSIAPLTVDVLVYTH